MTRKRSRIAVLMDNAFSFFQEEPRVGIARYAEEAGIDAVYFGMGLLRSSNPDDVARMGFFEFLTPAEFDGLILISSSLMVFGDSPIASFLRRAKPMPVVSIGPSIIGEDNVIADNRSGITAMMKHLIEDHGMRDFAFVSGPHSHVESNIRLETFRAALDRAGIRHDERQEYEGTLLPPSGFAAVEELIERRGLMPKAIVCANDFMAVGVRDALLARGLSVPFDVAVTGFDDIALTRSASSQFTTVQQSFDLMGYLAARKLHSLIRGEATAPLGTVPTELRVRGSCGCFDFQNRKSEAAQEQDDDVFASIKAKTDRLWTGEMLESDTLALRRAWLDIVQEAIKADRPT
jgi:DNA-binding LacI/PurR family transcriptional regulator